MVYTYKIKFKQLSIHWGEAVVPLSALPQVCTNHKHCIKLKLVIMHKFGHEFYEWVRPLISMK